MRLRADLTRVYKYTYREQSSDNGVFVLAEKKKKKNLIAGRYRQADSVMSVTYQSL